MNKPPPQLVWTDFVYALQDFLRQRQFGWGAYIVGGAVRDACLGGEIKDLDIAVDGNAVALARRVADWLNADIFVMDRERGVARVLLSGGAGPQTIDFARFRGATLTDDLRDRDFTFNAMAVDLLGDLNALIDPLDGQQDLQQRVLRNCSAGAIADDPIRALRAVRQSTQFSLKMHPDTLNALRWQAGGLAAASAERIRDELFKLLALEKAARGIRVLQHLDLLQYVLPGLAVDEPQRADAVMQSLPAVEKMSQILTAIGARRTDNTAAAFDLGMLVIQLDRYRPQLRAHIGRLYGGERRHGDLLMLAALVHRLAAAGADPAALGRALRLTGDEGAKLKAMIGAQQRLAGRQNASRLQQHRFWHRLRAGGIDAILLAGADFLGRYGARLEQSAWLEWVERAAVLLDAYFNHYESIVNPKLLLDGNDIKELLCLDSGPAVGRLLRRLREAQVMGEVRSIGAARDFVRGQHRR